MRAEMDADQRAAIIRDLDKHAGDAAGHAAFMSRKFRELMESGDDALSAADTLAADQAIEAAMRALPDARRIFAKYARLLDGAPPRLAIRSTGEPERLGIIARYPDGDLDVGDARRTGSGDHAGWRIRLTGDGRVRGSIGLCWDALVDEVLEAATRHMDERGPWWEAGNG